jgi:hypothetical protein
VAIDERIERLGERLRGLLMTAEDRQWELLADAEKITALARIAEIRERRLGGMEDGQR